MIEVEKKFLLDGQEETRLLEGAKSQGEKQITDTYFDNETFDLTRANYWLRRRGDEYELKVPMQANDNKTVDQFEELDDADTIRRALKLGEGTLAQLLVDAGYRPFMTAYTTRRKYTKAGFGLDLDMVTYADSDFHFQIAEIERMVENKQDMPAVIEEILRFARDHGLTTDTFILGKVGAFLRSERPEHYRALVAAGVL